MKIRGWSQEHIDYLTAHYSNNAIPLDTITAELGRTSAAVCAMAHRFGLCRIGRGFVKPFPDPFAVLSAPSMWVLGLWYSDGHVTRKHAYLTQKERELLEQVRCIVASPDIQDRVKIFPYHGKSQAWVLQISSVDMVRHLGTRGVHPRKSRTVEFPSWMPEDVLSHFVRGLWDGDGSIMVDAKGYLHMSYASGSLDFAHSLVAVVESVIGKRPTVYKRKNENCFTFAVMGKAAVHLGRWLYRDAPHTICLQRKRDVFFGHQSYPAEQAGHA